MADHMFVNPLLDSLAFLALIMAPATAMLLMDWLFRRREARSRTGAGSLPL